MKDTKYELEILYSCLIFDNNSVLSLNSLCSAISLIDLKILITVITPKDNFYKISKFLEKNPTKTRFIEDFSRGYYSALNLAIKDIKATKVLIFNSGDFFMPSSIKEFEKAILSNFDIYAFSTFEVSSSGKIKSYFLANSLPRLIALFRMPSPHMGLIIKKEIYQKFIFNKNIGYAADYYWYLQVLYSDYKYSYFPSRRALGVFYGGGISTSKGLFRGLLYQQKIVNKFLLEKFNHFLVFLLIPFVFSIRVMFVLKRIFKRLLIFVLD